jgi:MFS family permease
MQVPVGILLDRYGSKRLLIAASGLLFVAQSAFSLVDSYPAALAARAVLGVGDALVFISVLRIVMSWFPALRQPVMSQATGMLGGVRAAYGGVWVADPEAGTGNLRSDIYRSMWKGFNANNIAIPFPQREVRILRSRPS